MRSHYQSRAYQTVARGEEGKFSPRNHSPWLKVHIGRFLSLNIVLTLCIFTSNKCFRRSNQRNFARAFVSGITRRRCRRDVSRAYRRGKLQSRLMAKLITDVVATLTCMGTAPGLAWRVPRCLPLFLPPRAARSPFRMITGGFRVSRPGNWKTSKPSRSNSDRP